MVIIPHSNKDAIEIASKQLEIGKTICFPTETVYALACAIDNEDAINKIYEIKKRDINKSLSVLCSSIEEINYFANLDETIKKLIKKFSPGSVTYVVELKDEFKKSCKPFTENGFIGMRIPSNTFALDLLKNYNKPCIATSVNFSGKPSMVIADEVILYAKQNKNISLVVQGDEEVIGTASSVVKYKDKKLTVLRNGAVDCKFILEYLQSL